MVLLYKICNQKSCTVSMHAQWNKKTSNGTKGITGKHEVWCSSGRKEEKSIFSTQSNVSILWYSVNIHLKFSSDIFISMWFRTRLSDNINMTIFNERKVFFFFTLWPLLLSYERLGEKGRDRPRCIHLCHVWSLLHFLSSISNLVTPLLWSSEACWEATHSLVSSSLFHVEMKL